MSRTIRASAAQITSHAQKQNEKAADRLGVVYTPNEIVRFMIQGADWLCHKHFKRGLADPNAAERMRLAA